MYSFGYYEKKVSKHFFVDYLLTLIGKKPSKHFGKYLHGTRKNFLLRDLYIVGQYEKEEKISAKLKRRMKDMIYFYKKQVEKDSRFAVNFSSVL